VEDIGPVPNPDPDNTTDVPDPADLGDDGVLQCWDYVNGMENATIVNCTGLANSEARCAKYVRVWDVPDDPDMMDGE
jgi:hypothetical protein